MSELDRRLELEATVIGTLLLHPDKAGEAVAELKAEDFGEAMTRRLYETIRQLYLDGAPIDRVTISAKLGKDYSEAFDKIIRYGGDQVSYYAKLLREQAQVNRLNAAGLALAGKTTLDEASKAAEEVSALLGSSPRRKIYSMSELMDDFFDHYDEPVDYLQWGFKELDDNLFARIGDLLVIGGYPSSGKTAFSIQFGLSLAREYRVGFYSLETGPMTVSERILAHMGQVELWKIKKRCCNNEEQIRLAKARRKLDALNFDVIPCSGASVADIRAIALNRRHQIVIVDYLQLLDGKGKDRIELVTNVSKDIAVFARSQGITVIALSQLKRPEKSESAKKLTRPNMSSFRESGQIEQDADIAIILYPDDPNDNHSPRILSVAKAKDSERPQIKVDFDGARQTFKAHELTKQESYDQYNHKMAEYKRKQAAEKTQAQMGFEDLPDDGPLPF